MVQSQVFWRESSLWAARATGPCHGQSHPAESRVMRLADRQSLARPAHVHDHLAEVVAYDTVDVAHVHDDAAIDLPEHRRIQVVEQRAQRAADQSLGIRGDDARVLAFGAEVA